MALLKESLINIPVQTPGDMTDSNIATPSKVEGLTCGHTGQALLESSFTFPDSIVQTPSPSARISALFRKSAAVLPDSGLPESLTVVTPNTVSFAGFSAPTSTLTGH